MSKAHHSALNWLAPAVALLLCCSTAVNAQAPAKPTPEGPIPNAAAPANERFTLMTYDVGDLVISVRDYPYGGSTQSSPATSGGGGLGGGGGGFGGGGGGGQFSVPDEPRPRTQAQPQSMASPAPTMLLCQFGGGGNRGKAGAGAAGDGNQPLTSGSTIAMNDLIRVITRTIASSSWAENGGEGEVQSLGTALVVWQTKPVHDLVRELLSQIRQTSGHRTTLTVDARWLMLTSDELDTVFNRDSTNPAVDRKALAAFTRRAGSIRGITNCFSGQLVFLVSGTRRNVVSGYIPVVGAIENGNPASSLVSLHNQPRFQLVADTSAGTGARESHVGYQPIIETPNFGALLEIRPTSMGGAKSDVIVELKSTLTAPSDLTIATPRSTAAQDSMAPLVDRVSIETQELATTMRVPFGKPVLVGGMTYMPGSAIAADNAKSPERPQLYLVLEIR